MARYLESACRLCRREGLKLFLKGIRCNSEKCAFNRRNYSPGQHGQNRSKLSDYGIQLREKQKVKRIYGILERQFRRYFKESSRAKGVTGEMLLQMLERRLDNVILRCGFAVSLKQARQFVRYGHVTVNTRKIDIPSYQIKKQDKLGLKGKDTFVKLVKENLEVSKDRIAPSWLSVDKNNLKAEVNALPQRSDVPYPIQEQLIVELYSK